MNASLFSVFNKLPAYDRSPAEKSYEETFDLSRFQRFLDKLGNPEKGLPVIHIAGSKGKGSTAALIGSALQALGKRVGVFMSPYLNQPTESIFIDGKALTEAEFDAFMERYRPILEAASPVEFVTSFEVLTAMALQHFHDADVDFAILETGLGGRLDATNVVESPILSIICPIEKEHTAILGNSLTSIAYEKLGIVREETPVIVAHQDAFVLEFARSVCLQKKAPCFPVTGHYTASILNRSKEGYSFRLKTPQCEIPRISLSLLGDHQINNAITAWAALEQLLPDFDASKVLDVWAYLTLPGRFQIVEREGHDVILDGAHTLASARAVRRTLDEIYPQKPITFLLAFLEDKDVEGILKTLVKWGDAVVLTQVDHPRAIPARLLEEKMKALFPQDQVTCVITNNLSIAWQKALKMGRLSPICVTGSFRLVDAML